MRLRQRGGIPQRSLRFEQTKATPKAHVDAERQRRQKLLLNKEHAYSLRRDRIDRANQARL
jgi:hypothetical protein